MSDANSERNARSRQRLRELVARLDDETLRRQTDAEWTIGAILAHMAFWDESCVVRWQQFDRSGDFPSLSREIVDLMNEATLPTWRALPASVVRDLVVQAAEAADARTEQLSPEALAFVMANDRMFILERWEHREEHLNEIERFLE
jgi:sulfite reductase beta subunit-like hemoprotein